MSVVFVEGSLRLPNDLSYHELKRHFALARAWEMEQSEATSLQDLCTIMRDDAARAEDIEARSSVELEDPNRPLAPMGGSLGSLSPFAPWAFGPGGRADAAAGGGHAAPR